MTMYFSLIICHAKCIMTSMFHPLEGNK